MKKNKKKDENAPCIDECDRLFIEELILAARRAEKRAIQNEKKKTQKK